MRFPRHPAMIVAAPANFGERQNGRRSCRRAYEGQARRAQHRPAALGRHRPADPRRRHDRRRTTACIVAVGKEKDCRHRRAPTCSSTPKAPASRPGLIDSHVHPVFGDWTPRQNQLGWIDSAMNGGVTTMISAGEVHLPGRPKDIVGLKALAITAQRAFDNFRPGGVKVHGRRAGAREGHGRERLQGTRRRRRRPARRDRPRLGQGRHGSEEDGRRGRASTASRAPSTPAARRFPAPA